MLPAPTTFLHKPTCTYHVGLTLSPPEPSAWLLNGVTGFNIQTPRPDPKPSESDSHLGQTRWYDAEWGQGQSLLWLVK